MDMNKESIINAAQSVVDVLQVASHRDREYILQIASVLLTKEDESRASEGGLMGSATGICGMAEKALKQQQWADSQQAVRRG